MSGMYKSKDQTEATPSASYKFIVVGQAGEYSDYEWWPVASFDKQEDAESHLAKLNEWLSDTQPEYKAFLERYRGNDVPWEPFRSTLDPSGHEFDLSVWYSVVGVIDGSEAMKAFEAGDSNG